MIELSSHLRRHVPDENAFEWFLQRDGRVARQAPGRCTLEFEIGDRRYFIKIHHACGWKEVFKNLLRFRWPVIGAKTEWLAIEWLDAVGVATVTVAGKGRRGWNPATAQSFIVTEALEEMTSLEDLILQLSQVEAPIRWRIKTRLTYEVAQITRLIHQTGLNHRDYYLCHFLTQSRNWADWLPENGALRLYLIDLHRAQLRARVPDRWSIKDLAGLLFSALDGPFTYRDALRFIREYRETPLRVVFRREARFWRRVLRRSIRTYKRVHHHEPSGPFIENLLSAAKANSGNRPRPPARAESGLRQ